jgi:hypothetical protein
MGVLLDYLYPNNEASSIWHLLPVSLIIDPVPKISGYALAMAQPKKKFLHRKHLRI